MVVMFIFCVQFNFLLIWVGLKVFVCYIFSLLMVLVGRQLLLIGQVCFVYQDVVCCFDQWVLLVVCVGIRVNVVVMVNVSLIMVCFMEFFWWLIYVVGVVLIVCWFVCVIGVWVLDQCFVFFIEKWQMMWLLQVCFGLSWVELKVGWFGVFGKICGLSMKVFFCWQMCLDLLMLVLLRKLFEQNCSFGCVEYRFNMWLLCGLVMWVISCVLLVLCWLIIQFMLQLWFCSNCGFLLFWILWLIGLFWWKLQFVLVIVWNWFVGISVVLIGVNFLVGIVNMLFSMLFEFLLLRFQQVWLLILMRVGVLVVVWQLMVSVLLLLSVQVVFIVSVFGQF